MSAPGPAIAALLVITVFAVSLFNAALGSTGGVSFAVMASVLPPRALIPIHGIIESLSAFYRALLLRDRIDWAYTARFLVGAAVGLPLGMMLTGALAPKFTLAIIGVFILVSVWWPVRPLAASASGGIPAWAAGAVTTALTMVVGMTAPLVMAVMARHFDDPRRLIGTNAAVMTVQHGLKLPAFALMGFDFGPWLWLLAAMCAAVMAGTWIGKGLLGRWSATRFRQAFRLLMTVLAVRLVAAGAGWI